MLKVLRKSIKKVKKEALLSMVFVTFECIFEIAVPYLMSMLIDKGIEDGNFKYVERQSLIILGFVILQVASGVLCAAFAVKASTNFAGDLRERLFEKLQDFSFSNIDKFSTGSLVTRITQDIGYVQRSFQMTIRGAIRSIGMIIFSLVMAYALNVKIAFVFTLMLPIVLITLVLISKLAFPMFEKMFKAFDNLNNVISENIHGIRVVKSFNRKDYEFKKMKKHADEIFKFSVTAEKYIAFWDPAMNIALYGVIICIAWFGSKAIVASGNNPALGLTTGKLMSLMTYGIQSIIGVMLISMIYVMFVISSASLKRIKEVLSEEAQIKNCDEPKYEIEDGKIEFNNVSFKYNEDAKKYVLKDINIKINSGEMIGIIGGTGSGKSSFVNLIPRLYDVSVGEVKVSGINVKYYDIDTLRKNVGIVLQKNVLFSGTIASNLRFGNKDATYDEMDEACDIVCATEFIKDKPDGYESKVEQGGTNFSGGQKQRLSIARTILKKPKILIFDDSTSAVDTKTDAKIRDGLKNKLPNTTKIIISQRIISIKECDKIIVFDDGKVVGFDNHDNLIKNCPLYKDINDLQNN